MKRNNNFYPLRVDVKSQDIVSTQTAPKPDGPVENLRAEASKVADEDEDSSEPA
jgi:hypothetical protein